MSCVIIIESHKLEEVQYKVELAIDSKHDIAMTFEF